MPLNENGEPYILKVDSQNREYQVHPTMDGWSKSLTVNFLMGKLPVHVPLRGKPSQWKTVQKYVLRTYKVTAPVCKNCAQSPETDTKETSHDFIKLGSIKSGVLYRCFLGRYGTFADGDFTTLLMDYDNPNVFKCIRETTLDNQEEVLKAYMDRKIDFCADSELIHFIEKRLTKKL